MAEEITAGGMTVPLTHPDKVLFPAEGITKADLARYYADVAGAMLPWLRDRPVTMVRYPDGLGGERFFQKNVPSYFPAWIRRATVGKEGGQVEHVVCDKPATLVYLANQACIEIHAFTSRADKPGVPDQMVFDFDPPDGERFAGVRQAALQARELLEHDLGLASFVRTTGGRGLHVHVPLIRRADFERGPRVLPPGVRCAGPQAPGRHHHRAAQGQARQPHLRRCHAERLRADRGGQLWPAGPPGRGGRGAAELGRSRGRQPGSRSVHDEGGSGQARQRPGTLGRFRRPRRGLGAAGKRLSRLER